MEVEIFKLINLIFGLADIFLIFYVFILWIEKGIRKEKEMKNATLTCMDS